MSKNSLLFLTQKFWDHYPVNTYTASQPKFPCSIEIHHTRLQLLKDRVEQLGQNRAITLTPSYIMRMIHRLGLWYSTINEA